MLVNAVWMFPIALSTYSMVAKPVITLYVPSFDRNWLPSPVLITFLAGELLNIGSVSLYVVMKPESLDKSDSFVGIDELFALEDSRLAT